MILKALLDESGGSDAGDDVSDEDEKDVCPKHRPRDGHKKKKNEAELGKDRLQINFLKVLQHRVFIQE